MKSLFQGMSLALSKTINDLSQTER